MVSVRQRNVIQVWQDVIFAIFLREIKSKFNDRIGISWSVVSPLLFISALSYIRSLIGGDEVYSVPTFVFMMYGLVALQLFMGSVSSCARSTQRSKALFAFRAVQPIAAVIASGLFELLVKVFVVGFLFLIIYFFKMECRVDNFLIVLSCFLGVWIFALSIGLLFAVIETFVEEVAKIRELLMRPMFFISAVFFSLKDVPREYWVDLDWNPLLHAVELMRYGAYKDYGSEGVSASFLVLSVFGLFALACFSYQIAWKRMVRP